jgi:16S rRNA (guanine1207-N2)-methyltransferase
MSSPNPAPRAERLSVAFDAGLTLPDAGILEVVHPGPGEGLGNLPPERVHITTPYATTAAWFGAKGLACSIDPASAAAWVMLCLPRSREEGRDLLAQICQRVAPGTLVVVDGQKTDGVEAMLRDIRARIPIEGPISKGHGKIFWFPAPDAPVFADWISQPRQVPTPDGGQMETQPGLFSADGVDPGSALLARHLGPTISGRVIDLGAGWGYLSAVIAAQAPGVRELHLIESDARALNSARRNLSDPRAQFHWADATRPPAGLAAEWVVMNPPFHQGRSAAPALGAAFIAAAAGLLVAQGRLLLVANRHLPYEAALAKHFGRFATLEESGAYKIILAEAPRKAESPRAAAPRRRHR